jgi:hypothetical protein
LKLTSLWKFLTSPERSVLKRVWADDLRAVAPEEFVLFVGVGRAVLRERLNEAAGGSRVYPSAGNA